MTDEQFYKFVVTALLVVAVVLIRAWLRRKRQPPRPTTFTYTQSPPPLPPLPPHAALSMRLPAMAAPPNSRIIALLSITVFSLDIRMMRQPPEEGPWLTEVAATLPSLAWAPWTMTFVPDLRSLAEPFWRMRIFVVPVTFTWTTPPAVWT